MTDQVSASASMYFFIPGKGPSKLDGSVEQSYSVGCHYACLFAGAYHDFIDGRAVFLPALRMMYSDRPPGFDGDL